MQLLVVLSTMWALLSAGEPCPSSEERFTDHSQDFFDGRYFRLLAFDQLPTDAQRRAWKLRGVDLVDYWHPNQYFAVVSADFHDWESLEGLRKVSKVPLSMKIAASLWEGLIPEWAWADQEHVKVVIAYYKGLAPDKVRRALESEGFQVARKRDWAWQLEGTVPVNQVRRVASLPFVQYIDVVAPPPQLEENKYYLSAINRSNVLHHLPNGTYNGDGIRIMVSEGRRVQPLLEFSGRLWIWNSTRPEGGHITQVAYHAAGAGIPNPTIDNNAWGATIVSGPYPADYDTNYLQHQVLYTNHSLGYGVNGGYDAYARALDLLTETYPEVGVFFSAGNSGTVTGFAPYNLAGWANITGKRKQNKNHFATGSVDYLGDLFSFSSRGPMYDGRLYPLVVNEGQGGTSYASPKTMGNAAILQHVWKDLHNDSIAPAYLIRAVLALTADDIENPGPDFKTGFGLVNMRRAYHVLHNGWLMQDSVSQLQIDSFAIAVSSSLAQLRVLLMWPDPAAPINAPKGLVNDLDVELVAPNGTVYGPWVLNHFPHPDSLNQPARRGVDTLNNVELVSVDLPDSGTWIVRIRGAHVPMGPQPYVLAYELLEPNLMITFPHEGASFYGNDPIVVYWDDYALGSGSYTIKYQLDGGPWLVIASNVSASRRAYRWIPPSLSAGLHTIRFMIERGGHRDTSATATIVADFPKGIITQCTPARFSWDSVPGVSDYAVFYLDSTRMRRITTGITIQGTVATISGIDLSKPVYIAVAALDSTGYPGYWEAPAKLDLSGFRLSPPVSEGFESEDVGALSLKGSWIITPSSEGYSWKVNEQTTPSTGTGPSQAGEGNLYLYTEASLSSIPSIPPTTTLASPCINSNGGMLSFAYHMYGSDMGNLYVEGWDSASGQWTSLDSLIGAQQASSADPWTFRQVSLASLSAPYRIRFRGVRGDGYQSDMAIDAISIIPLTKVLKPVRKVVPQTGCALSSSESVQWMAYNMGMPIAMGDTLGYAVYINGVKACRGTYVLPQAIPSGDSLLIAPSCTADFSAPGRYILRISTWFDPNDSMEAEFEVYSFPVIDQFPYQEGFENDDGQWVKVSSGKSSWEWGVPASVTINTAAEGLRVWMTNLQGIPYDDERGWVLSPCFTSLPADTMELSVAVWWDAFPTYDGAAIDIRQNGKWDHLESADTLNWYVDDVYAIEQWLGSAHKRGWTGISSGWRNARIRFVADPTDTIQFRVAFSIYGNSVNNYDGFAFDDVALRDGSSLPSGWKDDDATRGMVYPNPVQNRLWIVMPQDGMGDIIITSIDGRVLLRHQRVWKAGLPFWIDLPEYFPTGMYILQVEGINGVRHWTLHKQ